MKIFIKVAIIPIILTLFAFHPLNNDPQSFLERGVEQFNNENYLEAISSFTMAVSIQDDLGSAYYHRGLAKSQLGKKMGYYNPNFCLDFIAAIDNEYYDAIEAAYTLGRNEAVRIDHINSPNEEIYNIDMSNQGVESISQQYHEYPHLIALNLSHNNISELENITGNNSYLLSLDIGHNELRHIPSSIQNCTYLYDLNLSHNNIKSLPDQITTLSHLAYLNLRGNRLHSLPKNIQHLKSLKVLDLSLNQFKKLPKDISQLKGLDVLVLSGNPISKSDIKKLKLELHDTQIIFDM
ncbi:hypothetical protein [Flammeovirga sp. SubArs3]|uniref:leucine-rich repeat domain-containing protein n=1 Tax=Flammeovirga sp. SubArs3 TaxID=2995316 RepID=UPI00248CBF05|nr:hypothetical protein [Flammeovirga sp. SubArs3]